MKYIKEKRIYLGCRKLFGAYHDDMLLFICYYSTKCGIVIVRFECFYTSCIKCLYSRRHNMEYIKNHKALSIVIGVGIVLVIGFAIFFTIAAKNNEVVVEPLTFQEKYAETENKIKNLIATDAEREGYKADLMTYSDKVKQEYNMTLEEKDAFITFTRKIDKVYLESKAHVLTFHGKVKEQYDKDVANNYFRDEIKANIDTLFNEYNLYFREGKYQDAYNKLDEISKHLSVRVNENGVVNEQATQVQAQAQAQAANGQQPLDPQAAANVKGRAYHPEATAGQQISDPINGNPGVVAQNGIEVYRLPNDTTYTYLTKEEFIAMNVRIGMPESLARQMADAMANAQGLITVAAEDDGTYE